MMCGVARRDLILPEGRWKVSRSEGPGGMSSLRETAFLAVAALWRPPSGWKVSAHPALKASP